MYFNQAFLHWISISWLPLPLYPSTYLGDIEVVHLLTPLIEDELPHVTEQLPDAFGQDGLATAGAADPWPALATPRSPGPVIVFVDAKQPGKWIHSVKARLVIVQIRRAVKSIISKPEELEKDVLAHHAL